MQLPQQQNDSTAVVQSDPPPPAASKICRWQSVSAAWTACPQSHDGQLGGNRKPLPVSTHAAPPATQQKWLMAWRKPNTCCQQPMSSDSTGKWEEQGRAVSRANGGGSVYSAPGLPHSVR